MNRYDDETPGSGRDGVPSVDQDPAGSRPAAQRTMHLLALDHLAAGLRAEGSEAPDLTWAQLAQRTLSAAQHADPSSSARVDLLQRRMVLNDALFSTFMRRKHGRPWTLFDRPTLLLTVADLLEAAHTPPTPRA